jgi:hypothetical protein
MLLRTRNSVVEMTRCTSISPLGSEFDNFLFAPIVEDRNGMLLSVLSALARLDVEPWQEAAQLARLPQEAATQRLALLIAALPGGPSTHPDPGTIAGRLIGLLPRRPRSDISSRDTLPGASAVANSRILTFVIIMAFMLGVQFIVASRQPPPPADNATGPASSTLFPQAPPSSSGH